MATDVVEFLLQGKPVNGRMRKTEKQADSPIQQEKRITERPLYFFRSTANGCRIRNTPMRRHRLPGPHRTDLVRGVVTNCENEVKLRGPRCRKLVPTLAPKPRCRNACDFKLVQCFRAYPSRRMASRAVSRELRSALEVHDPFGHDRPRRIARAQKQNVVMRLHLANSQSQQLGPQHSFGFTARTKALMILPSTCGAIALTSMFWSARNSRASSTL